MSAVIPDYPSNNQGNKPTKPKMEKVVTGNVTTTKHSTKSTFLDIFGPVIVDAIVPTLKDAVVSIITNGINILVYGDSGKVQSRIPASSISYGHTNYSKISSSRNEPAPISARRQNFDDLVLANRGDAEIVLDRLREAIESFGCVTVLNAYDLCGLEAPYTSDKYGWMDLENAYVERVRNGFAIRLPRAVPID